MAGSPGDRAEGAVTIRVADWRADRGMLERVRRTVFIEEQGVSEEDEWDEQDPASLHLLALVEKRDAVGTARIGRDGRIGRVAVLAEYRGGGVGRRLMDRLLDIARQRGLDTVELHAQTRAQGFYTRLGFRPAGAPFEEAGIEHVRMTLELTRREDLGPGKQSYY